MNHLFPSAYGCVTNTNNRERETNKSPLIQPFKYCFLLNCYYLAIVIFAYVLYFPCIHLLISPMVPPAHQETVTIYLLHCTCSPKSYAFSESILRGQYLAQGQFDTHWCQTLNYASSRQKTIALPAPPHCISRMPVNIICHVSLIGITQVLVSKVAV